MNGEKTSQKEYDKMQKDISTGARRHMQHIPCYEAPKKPKAEKANQKNIKQDRKQQLTPAEMEIMDILWRSNKPMASNEILASGLIGKWSSGYLHNVLRSMLKKEVVRVNGIVQNNTQYARMFEPVLTRPEYAARLALSVGITADEIGDVVEALRKIIDGYMQ